MMANEPAPEGRDIHELPTLAPSDAGLDALEEADGPTLLEDRYEILETRGGSGKSGMGVVYIARDGDERIAIKTFQRQFARDLVLVQRFIREVRTWMLLGFHPHIVRARRLDIIDAVPYLFMEYVPSDHHGRHALSEWIRQGPLSVAASLEMGIQICAAMAHATAAVPGLVHRDLKPENILVDPSGMVKLTDFGLVRCGLEANALDTLLQQEGPIRHSLTATQAGAIFGTPAYMAPEQFESAAEVTKAADIYAVGCCLFEMITGKPPFYARTGATLERIVQLKRMHHGARPPRITERAPDCPPDVEGLILHCLEKDPEDRWPDFESLGEALREALERDCGRTPKTWPQVEVNAADVSGQMRSLTLLDGYDHAMRMRHLRERHQASPYAFHLALASYFRHAKDVAEEERQLQKALRAQTGDGGYEAVRRLAELCLAQQRIDEAERLLANHLAQRPEDLDQTLEPYVQMLLARKRFDQVRHLLDERPEALRIQWLRAQLLRQEGREETLADLLRVLLAESLDELQQQLHELSPEELVGWGRPGDTDILQDVLASLRPDLNTEILDVVEEAVWPDMRGFPDFAPPMAWLSEWLGGLAALSPPAVDSSERLQYRDCAALLGYPHRLRRHLQRDEAQLWNQEPASGG